ncbi:MAG TPA: hypothetical protein VHI99_19800 [Vicinamibacterales bacterium]|jgi:hypothetical protein|nr:hypothetical protein [Vicinamibacterales bacterium]
MERNAQNGNSQMSDRDTLFLLGGAAFVLFGAGLLLSTDTVKRYLGQVGVGDLVQATMPDVDKYLKLRSM